MANLDIAGNIISVDKMFNDAFTNQQAQQQEQAPQQTLPQPQAQPVSDGSEQSFQDSFFPQYKGQAPEDILENLGPLKSDPSRVKYRFIGDGKIYNAKADKPLDKVLEGIWDKNAPGLWGSAKAQTLYGLPADLSSAIAYGLGGIGLDESSDDWKEYSNGLREEFQKKYGQFMTPGFHQALEKGRLWDFATQNIGYMAPYMGLALAGGLGGAAAAESVAASTGLGATVGASGAVQATTGALAIGEFLGSAAITSPITIAQFADRQVAEMKAAGLSQEEAEKRIDWLKAAGLGTVASGLQALPVTSILGGGPLMGLLTNWGVKQGTPLSARILASLADTAGTNALAGAGTSYLSRMNADMPLLDDNAKAEYLEAGIIGGLVGIPFGIYRGMRPHYKPVDNTKSLDQIISENQAPEPTEQGPNNKPEVAGYLPPPKHIIIHNPNETYGIQNAEDATAYLNNINYKSAEDGQMRNGLDDFVRKHGTSYSDAEIIDAARRVSRGRSAQDFVQKTPDGVVYPSIDSIPQVHSNDPRVLTKAAELTDRYAYEDAFVRSLSDERINQLHEVNLKRDLAKTTSQVHKDVFNQILEKAKNFVNEKTIQDVQQYGSLYARPEAKERVNLSTKERREMISKNPREEMAKAILSQKRPQERDAQRQPNEVEPLGDRSLAKLTKDAKGKFLKQAVRTGQERQPEGPRALLEYKPLVDMIDKGANQPGPRVTPEISKADFNEFLQNAPFIKDLFGKDAKLDDIKKSLARGKKELARVEKEKQKQAEAARNPYPEPKLDKDGNPILKPQPSTFSSGEKGAPKLTKELPFSKDEESFLSGVRDRLSRIAAERNEAFLKANPELAPALNDMFKRFSEIEGMTELTKNSTTKAFRAKPGILDALENRARVSRALQNAFQYLDKKIGTRFANIVDNMLAGKEVTPYEAADALTLLDMAFNFDNPTEFKHISTGAMESIYKQIRNSLPDSTKKSLENSRDFLEKWYKSTKDVNAKDLKAWKAEDLEADAFTDYMQDTLVISAKQFKGSKQQKIFGSIETALKRLKKELNDQDFKTVEDLLEFNKASNERVPPEAQRPGVFHRRVVEEVQKNQNAEKVVQAQKAVEENANEQNNSIPKNGFQKPPSEYKGQEMKGPLEETANNVGNLWHSFAWLRSIPSLAREVPMFAKVYNNILAQQDLAAHYQNQFGLKFSKIFDEGGGWQPMNEAHNILDHLRMTDQRIAKDSSGRLVFKKDGQDVTLNHAMTKAVEDVTDLYKEAYRIKEGNLRKDMAKYFKDDNITEDSSLNHVKRVIKAFDEKIKGNPLPEVAAKYRLQKEALEQLHDKLDETQRIIQKDEPYVPFMRFGDYVVDVIDRKTGEQVFMTSINEQNKFGSKNRLPTEKEAKQKMQELGLHKQFDPNKYELRHYQLTHNKIGEYIQKGLVSTDLIQSLMSSGMNEHLRVADHFATDISDPTQFFKDMSADINTNKYRILRYVAARGAGRFGIKSKNIPGYSKDWGRVVDSYMNIQANSLAKQAKLQEWGESQAELVRGQMPQHLRDKINKYIDYQNDPGNDYARIREMNFIMAMGMRPSSAVLQLLTLPQQAFALGLEYSPTPLKNMGAMSKAIARTVRNVTSMGREKLHPEIQAMVDSEPGFFRTGIMQDVLKEKIPGQDFISMKLPKGSMGEKAAQVVGNRVGKIPGMFIQPAERLTRVSTFDFYYTMFKERPETIRNALKQKEKDYNWQEFWKHHKDRMGVEQAMAIYSMLETHGVYGKVARGDLQRGLGGALLFPFTTYAQQMMEVLGSQLSMQRGLPGLYAGLWTMGSYLALAGAAGIPAYDLWKTMYEQYQSKVNNRTVDAEMEMKESGVPDWMRHGLLSTATGLDLSSRIGQEVVGQNLLKGLVKGEFKVNEIGGIPGRTFQGVMDGMAAWGNETSTTSPMALVAPLVPAAITDLGKAYQLATAPEDVLKTSSGKMIRDPNSIDTGDIIARAAGFGTLEDKEARQKIYWQQRANQEFNQAKSRLAEGIAMARYKMVMGSRTGNSEQYDSGRELLKEMQRALMKHAKDNKIVLNTKFWQGFNRNVQDRLWQKMNPGKIRKPTEGEMRHIESLIDNE